MKRLLLAGLLLIAASAAKAQTFCDPNGNILIYSNYDGGNLTINVDVNIPNIKIGVVTYETVNIVVTGAYASNVTEVVYAGYNATNNHCGFSTPTSITSTSSNNVVNIMPTATLNNTYGNQNIICNYSCSNTTSQGGCNTPDQVEAYFMSIFPGSTIRYHYTQYNCWNTMNVSSGGNCCGSITALTAQATATQLACYGACNSTATASAIGGTPPYSYQWQGGPATATWANRCAGTYLVTVTDAANNTDTQSVTISNPPIISTTIADTACQSFVFNSSTITQSGIYYDTLTSSGGCDSFITLNLTIGSGVNTNTSLSNGTLTSAQANGQYQWIRCPNNTIIAGATAQSYTPTQSGNYAVIVTYMACSDTSGCTNVIPVNVPAAPNRQEFNVYPNPARTEVYIEGAAAGNYRLTDQAGRLVLSGRHNAGKTTLSLKELAAGLYFLYLDDSQPVKLLKQ